MPNAAPGRGDKWPPCSDVPATTFPIIATCFASIASTPRRCAPDLDYLDDLPYLTKDIIREQGPRLVSSRFSLESLHLRKTGGSTGPSTRVYYSNNALDWTAAVNLVCMQWAGKCRQMREMHLASRFPEKFPWKDRLKEWFKCLVLNRQNLFTDNFDAAGLDSAWRRLRRAAPISCKAIRQPSMLWRSISRERGVSAHGAFHVFESTGEVLDVKKRETIESVFGCRAIDRFGNAEFGVLAYEALDETEQRLRVLDAVAWPEQLEHGDGPPELVFTGLRNDAMPLVRYRTGDLAQLDRTDTGFYVRNIVGRVHDVVRSRRIATRRIICKTCSTASAGSTSFRSSSGRVHRCCG